MKSARSAILAILFCVAGGVGAAYLNHSKFSRLADGVLSAVGLSNPTNVIKKRLSALENRRVVVTDSRGTERSAVFSDIRFDVKNSDSTISPLVSVFQGFATEMKKEGQDVYRFTANAGYRDDKWQLLNVSEAEIYRTSSDPDDSGISQQTAAIRRATLTIKETTARSFLEELLRTFFENSDLALFPPLNSSLDPKIDDRKEAATHPKSFINQEKVASVFEAAVKIGTDPSSTLEVRKEAIRRLYAELERTRSKLQEGDSAAIAEYQRQNDRYEELLRALRAEIAAQVKEAK